MDEKMIEEIRDWVSNEMSAKMGEDHNVIVTHDDWNRITNYFPKLLSHISTLEAKVKELEIKLGEAQQWIDSEPDWKDTYNKNYQKLLDRVKEFEDAIILWHHNKVSETRGFFHPDGADKELIKLMKNVKEVSICHTERRTKKDGHQSSGRMNC